MVKNVSFTGGYSAQQVRDLENVVKYATGTAINFQEEGPFTGQGLFMVGMPVVGAAWGGSKWLWNGYKSKDGISGAWEAYKAESKLNAEAFQAAQGIKGKYGLIERAQDAKRIMGSMPSAEKLAKLDNNTQSFYKKANELAELSTKGNQAQNSEKLVQLAEENFAKAKTIAKAAPATSMWEKFTRAVGKYTGFSKLSEGAEKLATKFPAVSKVMKHGKGAGIFLAIEAGLAVFTQIIPTFNELGVAKGLKQLGKSCVKVAARVGGWVAGEAVGTAGGALLGAQIGLIGGPVGAAIGGVIGGICGFAGGLLGQWAAGKAADAIVGKDELEIAKEEQAKKVMEEASNNPQAMQEIMAAASNRLEQEGANSPDGKIAFNSLKKLTQQYAQADKTKTQAAAGQNPNINNDFIANQAGANPFGQYTMPSFDQGQDYMDKDFMSMRRGFAV